MALKGDRVELQTDLSFICNDVAERGVVLHYKTFGSGINLDDASNVVTLAAAPSGSRPAGLLLNNMVSIDTTRQHINFHKDELVTGSHCTLLRQGWVVTDRIVASTSPNAGDRVFCSYSGLLTNSLGGGANTGPFGEWMGQKDPDSYAKVAIHMPLL